MKLHLLICTLSCFLLFLSSPALSQPVRDTLPDSVKLRVVIIRHGEKPKKGDNLSCQGLNRALALPNVLYSMFGVPDYSYVPTMKTGKSTSSVRMFQTITPFAVQYNIMVNSAFKETDTAAVAKDARNRRGTVLLVWEHGNIPGVARNLGVVSDSLAWDGTDFDSIWIIEYGEDKKGKLKKPVFAKQQENIDPSPNCPGTDKPEAAVLKK
jgi:hypothetical protein